MQSCKKYLNSMKNKLPLSQLHYVKCKIFVKSQVFHNKVLLDGKFTPFNKHFTM